MPMEKRENKWLLNYITSLLPENITVRVRDCRHEYKYWTDFEICFCDKRKDISTPAIPLWIKRNNLKKPFIKKMIKKGLEYLNKEHKELL